MPGSSPGRSSSGWRIAEKPCLSVPRRNRPVPGGRHADVVDADHRRCPSRGAARCEAVGGSGDVVQGAVGDPDTHRPAAGSREAVGLARGVGAGRRRRCRLMVPDEGCCSLSPWLVVSVKRRPVRDLRAGARRRIRLVGAVRVGPGRVQGSGGVASGQSVLQFGVAELVDRPGPAQHLLVRGLFQ